MQYLKNQYILKFLRHKQNNKNDTIRSTKQQRKNIFQTKSGKIEDGVIYATAKSQKTAKC